MNAFSTFSQTYKGERPSSPEGSGKRIGGGKRYFGTYSQEFFKVRKRAFSPVDISRERKFRAWSFSFKKRNRSMSMAKKENILSPDDESVVPYATIVQSSLLGDMATVTAIPTKRNSKIKNEEDVSMKDSRSTKTSVNTKNSVSPSEKLEIKKENVSQVPAVSSVKDVPSSTHIPKPTPTLSTPTLSANARRFNGKGSESTTLPRKRSARGSVSVITSRMARPPLYPSQPQTWKPNQSLIVAPTSASSTTRPVSSQMALVATSGPNGIQAGALVQVLPKKKKKQRRKRIFWTTCEETHLRLGVREFGVGKWAKILQKYPNIFKNRTSVDLKDKWRNISKKNPTNAKLRASSSTSGSTSFPPKKNAPRNVPSPLAIQWWPSSYNPNPQMFQENINIYSAVPIDSKDRSFGAVSHVGNGAQKKYSSSSANASLANNQPICAATAIQITPINPINPPVTSLPGTRFQSTAIPVGTPQAQLSVAQPIVHPMMQSPFGRIMKAYPMTTAGPMSSVNVPVNSPVSSVPIIRHTKKRKI
mmetsp:Transcript_12453/g.18589  ORF Transcript_12453/g.18589 Transcript_12453/m.18589 type:complete len:532 (-) Transcript_12453:199-1794(-)